MFRGKKYYSVTILMFSGVPVLFDELFGIIQNASCLL